MLKIALKIKRKALILKKINAQIPKKKARITK